jgi:hypothetical protein
MFKWISYGKLNARENLALKSIDEGVESDYFHKREFSFTLENDVYCRYLCFKTAEQFKATLVDRLPFKIDIGAVFNISLTDTTQVTRKPSCPSRRKWSSILTWMSMMMCVLAAVAQMSARDAGSSLLPL